jgi:hypothetical protein
VPPARGSRRRLSEPSRKPLRRLRNGEPLIVGQFRRELVNADLSRRLLQHEKRARYAWDPLDIYVLEAGGAARWMQRMASTASIAKCSCPSTFMRSTRSRGRHHGPVWSALVLLRAFARQAPLAAPASSTAFPSSSLSLSPTPSYCHRRWKSGFWVKRWCDAPYPRGCAATSRGNQAVSRPDLTKTQRSETAGW